MTKGIILFILLLYGGVYEDVCLGKFGCPALEAELAVARAIIAIIWRKDHYYPVSEET